MRNRNKHMSRRMMMRREDDEEQKQPSSNTHNLCTKGRHRHKTCTKGRHRHKTCEPMKRSHQHDKLPGTSNVKNANGVLETRQEGTTNTRGQWSTQRAWHKRQIIVATKVCPKPSEGRSTPGKSRSHCSEDDFANARPRECKRHE